MITKEQLNNYNANLEEQRKEAELQVAIAKKNLKVAISNRDAVSGAQQALNLLIRECENNEEKDIN